MMLDLFHEPGTQEIIGNGAVLLRGFVLNDAAEILMAVNLIAAQSPFRHMIVPGGHTMSVAITNCGRVGWISDRKGYRYDPVDPQKGRPWPPLPGLLIDLAARAAAQAGYPGFAADACLINCYVPGAGVSLHQDKNERNFAAPIVSVSLGLPAAFLFGGLKRSDRAARYRLAHGDVAVWGGASRMVFHGITPLKPGMHPLTGERRINLTFRTAL